MNKYDISQAQITMADIREQISTAGKYKTPPQYVSLLAHTVSELFQCDFFWTTRYSWERSTYLTAPVSVGMDPHQEIASYVYDVLVRQLIRARRTFQTRYSYRSIVTEAKDSYAVGWVEAIRRKVADMVPERATMQAGKRAGSSRCGSTPRLHQC